MRKEKKLENNKNQLVIDQTRWRWQVKHQDKCQQSEIPTKEYNVSSLKEILRDCFANMERK